MARSFVLDPGWSVLLRARDIRPANLLRLAGLPEDLFNRQRPEVEADEMGRFLEAFSRVAESDAPGLTLGRAVTETLSPMVFAFLCSPDLKSAITRLSAYKPLVSPFEIEQFESPAGFEITLRSVTRLPAEAIAAEFVALIKLARLATGIQVRPLAVEMVEPPTNAGYSEFFGKPLFKGHFDRIVLTRGDTECRLMSPAPELFESFPEALQPRLDELPSDASVKLRSQSVLMEAIPAGQPEASIVAARLGLSVRSYQRRLAEEGTSFKIELQKIRTELARHYLEMTPLSGAEIAFLLGYDDPNSFIRAFHVWTGTTPEAMRREIRKAA